MTANYVLSKIKSGKLSHADIVESKHFAKICDRYEHFSAENIFSLRYTDVIIDFDITKVARSKLVHTKFILFEKTSLGFRHLCIAKKSDFYAETFFSEPTDYYIKNQHCEKITRMKITKSDGTVLFEDEFAS